MKGFRIRKLEGCIIMKATQMMNWLVTRKPESDEMWRWQTWEDMMTVQEKPKKYKVCTWEKGIKRWGTRIF